MENGGGRPAKRATIKQTGNRCPSISRNNFLRLSAAVNVSDELCFILSENKMARAHEANARSFSISSVHGDLHPFLLSVCIEEYS